MTWDDVLNARRFVAGLPMEDEMSYTKGPWHRETDGSIVADARYVVLAEGFDRGWDENMANAARIVECVNACEGIENPAQFQTLMRDIETLQKILSIPLEQRNAERFVACREMISLALAALGVR